MYWTMNFWSENFTSNSKRVPIYQEYDDFLKKRRRDRRAEFPRHRREPGEELLTSKSHKALLKYFGAPVEDTFCYCNTGSYDEMIACDNPKCPIEWFHFACVGLETRPTTLWFCDNCSGTNK